jgi:hypothetical protein
MLTCTTCQKRLFHEERTFDMERVRKFQVQESDSDLVTFVYYMIVHKTALN